MAQEMKVHPSVFIGEGARVFGEVTIGENSSVWFNAVIRGDEGPITIGANSNIQDCCVLHSDLGIGTEIGDWVTIGHGSVVRGAKIGDGSMIGMNSTVMTGAVIGEHCVVGAHSFVPYNAKYPPGTMLYGVPAKVVRELSESEREAGKKACQVYLKLAEQYRSGGVPRL